MRDVFISGVGITPFRKSLASTVAGLATDATAQALADAGLTPDRVGMVFLGNAMSGVVTGQEMIRAQAALRDTGLSGAPMVSVENACASSSSAAHLAWLAVAAGQVDVALAVGAEKMTAPDKTKALWGLASAVDLARLPELEAEIYGEAPVEGAGAERSLFMDIYSFIATQYMEQSGATAEDFARVVVKNRAHAGHNPNAQYRDPMTVEEVLGSRKISGPLTLPMCSPIGDGAAAVVFRAPEVAATVGAVRVRSSVLVSGIPGRTGPTATERAAERAYALAGIGPDEVDVAEVHDATAPAELLIYEELGLCGSGEGPKFLADGDTALGGRVPVNTSGGLISKGHPVGATGCAQLVELTEQLRGRAGARQVEGARVGVAENGGGYLGQDPAACVVTVLSRD